MPLLPVLGAATRYAATACEDPRAEKEAWVSEVLREWGSCGRVALVDDRLVGYLVYAPAGVRAGRRRLPDGAGLARTPCC